MAKEKPNVELVRALTDKETEATYAGPAIFSNRFFVITSPTGARITFAEQGGPDEKIHFRTAVTLSLENSKLLCSALQQLVKIAEDAGTEIIKQQIAQTITAQKDA